MKSRTSFSNLTPFKKDLLRFAPVWALYLAGLLLTLVTIGDYGYYDHFGRNFMPGLIKAFGIVNLIYGSVCAVMLFGDLFNTRMCYSLHALPQRREHWLFSHLAAGMVFSLVPNFLASLLLMVQLEGYWFLALYWLLASTLQFMFFFGLGALSTLLTGNRFAALLVCAGFNFVAMLVYGAIEVFYVSMLEGVFLQIAHFARFSPVVFLYTFDFFTFGKKTIPVEDAFQKPGNSEPDTRTFYIYEGLGNGWGYLVILGVLGLALAAVCVWLYRKRHLESAGDFLAFPKLKAPACVIICLCVALCAALLGAAVSGNYLVWLFVGLIIGFFGGLMLLERRLKVFRKKTFLGFGVLTVCMILSLVATDNDWFGVEQWTPNADRVASVTIANYRSTALVENDYYYGSRISVTLDDQEDISQIIDAHEDILDRLNYPHEQSHRVTIQYKLKSGRIVTRSYSAPADGTNYGIFMKYFNTPEQVLGCADMTWEEYVQAVGEIYYNGTPVPEGLKAPLLSALKADCEIGAVVSENTGGKYSAYSLDFSVEMPDRGMRYRMVFIGNNAANTLAILHSPQIVLQYDDWEAYLQSIRSIEMNGVLVPGNLFRDALEAMKADIEKGKLTAEYPSGGFLYSVAITSQHSLGYKTHVQLFITKECTNTINWFADNMRGQMGSIQHQLGFLDLESFLKTITVMEFNGISLPMGAREELLKAMMMDVEAGTLWKSDGVNQVGKFNIYYEWINESGKFHRYFYVYEGATNTLAWLYAYNYGS